MIAVEDARAGVPEEDRDLHLRPLLPRRRWPAVGARRATASASAWPSSPSTSRLHGGRVWVEDRPDGQPGARFVVELPVACDERIEPTDASVP